MTHRLLWRASLAFVLHCTPAMADHFYALFQPVAHVGHVAAPSLALFRVERD